MKIKHTNGSVKFKMRAGKDFVRNTMPLATANRILENAKDVKVLKSEIICDNNFFFPRLIESKKKESKIDE